MSWWRAVVVPVVIGISILGYYLVRERNEHLDQENQLEQRRLVQDLLTAYYAGDWDKLLDCCGVSARAELELAERRAGRGAIPVYRGNSPEAYHPGDRLGLYDLEVGLLRRDRGAASLGLNSQAPGLIVKAKCRYALVNQTTHRPLALEGAAVYLAREAGEWRVIAVDGMHLEKWISPERLGIVTTPGRSD